MSQRNDARSATAMALGVVSNVITRGRATTSAAPRHALATHVRHLNSRIRAGNRSRTGVVPLSKMTTPKANCTYCNGSGRMPLFVGDAPCVCLDAPATPEPEPVVCEDAEEPEDNSLPTITIDGEVLEIEHVSTVVEGGALVSADGREYVVFPDRDTAGEAARDYWRDMAENDPDEFTCMVGKETLISWAFGNPAGPGYNKACSLNDWLDGWIYAPEEHWGSWDGSEYEVDGMNAAAEDEIGFVPEVAYRHN